RDHLRADRRLAPASPRRKRRCASGSMMRSSKARSLDTPSAWRPWPKRWRVRAASRRNRSRELRASSADGRYLCARLSRRVADGLLTRPARNEKIADHDLNRLGLLVEGRGAHLDPFLVGTGLGRPDVEDFALDMEFIPVARA